MRLTPTKKFTFQVMIVTFLAGCAAIWAAIGSQDPDWLKGAMGLFATGNLLGILGVRLRNF